MEVSFQKFIYAVMGPSLLQSVHTSLVVPHYSQEEPLPFISHHYTHSSSINIASTLYYALTAAVINWHQW